MALINVYSSCYNVVEFEADYIDIADGILSIFDEEDLLVGGFAPGAWQYFVRREGDDFEIDDDDLGITGIE